MARSNRFDNTAPERPCDMCTWANVPVTRWNKKPEGERFCASCEKTVAEQRAVEAHWGIDSEGNWLDEDGNITKRVDALGRVTD